jgi:ATP-dependent DNA helicase PIF1
MSGRWEKVDDVRLWASRSNPTAVLAAEFDRSKGGIRSRLKHLQNPDHKAYQRLFGTNGASTTAALSAVNVARQTLAATQAFDAATALALANPRSRTVTTIHAPAPVLSDYAYSHSAVSTNYKPSTDPPLNPEQERVLQLVLTGRNVFLTGSAGVGKSFLLRHIMAVLKSCCYKGGDSIAVTASTGIAASHISGITLHSWAGIGIASGRDVPKLVQKVGSNPAALHRWRNTQTLIVDEISMIDGVLFEALDALGKAIRGDQGRPFGGIQLILSGDLYQLPPVSLRHAGFAFSSNAWKHGNIQMTELKTIVRQQGDFRFVSILRQLREGRCSSEVETLLATCHASIKKGSTDGIVPTKLYCTNKNVDTDNRRHLEQLPGTMRSYPSTDRFKGVYSSQVQSNLRKMMNKKAPAVLCLKRGAQVMLLKNTPEWKLVNGSRGVVVGFDKNNFDNPIILFTNGVTHTIEPFGVFQAAAGGAMTRSQLPIKLACK